MRRLTDTQAAAVDKLRRLKCGALFMEAGTGKTRVAVELINPRAVDCVIWIAPASLLRTENYLNEIWRWHCKHPIFFFTIEGVSASDTKFLEMLKIAREKKAFCVVDESITIKNTDAGRTRRLLAHYDAFAYRLILNGTPVTKGLIDIYSQMQFLSPKILNMTEAQFANKFLTYRQDGSFKPWQRWSKPENEAALVEIIRPYIFDCALDLPVSVSENDVDFYQTDAERASYADFKRAYLQDKADLGFLEVAQKLQHFYTNSGQKDERLKQIVGGILDKGEKVIIYVKFLDEIERIRRFFDCVVFSGAEKGDLSRFEAHDGAGVLLCTYGVGSFGLNLQAANNVVYYSQTFDYKEKEQSRHRVVRTGQTRAVSIFNFWLDTGLEKIIRKSLEKKRSTLANVKEFIEKNGIQEL